MTTIFQPASKSSCYFFFFLSLGMLVFFVLEIIYIGYIVINKFPLTVVFAHMTHLFWIFISYLINRILYNMCLKTL